MASFREAVLTGVAAIEGDARRSRDGHVVRLTTRPYGELPSYGASST